MADGKFLIGKPSGGVTTVTVTDGADNTNLVLPESGTVATLSNIQGFKNLIINGKKAVNQRGLTSTDNSYNQDRWYKAGNNWFQGIEGDNNLVSGKKFTLSWTGAATAGYYVGNATSSTINAQTFTPITNGGTFTLTIAAGQNLWIKFISDATGSTFNFVQLEEGNIATPFENRPYGLELSLCQRYYEVDAVLESADNGRYFSHSFKVDKRVIPTIVAIGGYGAGATAVENKGYSLAFTSLGNTFVNITASAEL